MNGVLVVFADPVDKNLEEEFNEWYSAVHVPQILKLPSFTSARRFRLTPGGAAGPPAEYLTIYEVTDTSLAAGELTEAAQEGRLTMSEAIHVSAAVQGYFDALPRD